MMKLSLFSRFKAHAPGAAEAPAPALPEPPPAVPAAGPEGPGEVGGRDGPEPTRFGDWEMKGRCIDF